MLRKELIRPSYCKLTLEALYKQKVKCKAEILLSLWPRVEGIPDKHTEPLGNDQVIYCSRQ